MRSARAERAAYCRGDRAILARWAAAQMPHSTLRTPSRCWPSSPRRQPPWRAVRVRLRGPACGGRGGRRPRAMAAADDRPARAPLISRGPRTSRRRRRPWRSIWPAATAFARPESGTTAFQAAAAATLRGPADRPAANRRGGARMDLGRPWGRAEDSRTFSRPCRSCAAASRFTCTVRSASVARRVARKPTGPPVRERSPVGPLRSSAARRCDADRARTPPDRVVARWLARLSTAA